MSKAIKQIADEIGLSKAAIRKKSQTLVCNQVCSWFPIEFPLYKNNYNRKIDSWSNNIKELRN